MGWRIRPPRARSVLFTIVTLIACALGACWYAVHTQIIIISMPAHAEYFFQRATKKNIMLFWNGEQERTDCIWAESTQQNIATITAAWLAYAQDDGHLDKHIALEMITLTPAGNEAFISFSRSLFESRWSTRYRWQVLESLVATLRPLFPDLKLMRLLVRKQTWHDDHIDVTASLPVASCSTQDTQSEARLWPTRKHAYTVVLRPAGDKNNTGRVIAREFERMLTRELAQRIKGPLEDTHRFNVIITHDIGHSIDQEEAASLANRVHADAYIHLNCFESTQMLPEIICAFPLYNPATDFWTKKRDSLSLKPIDKAYLHALTYSAGLCTALVDTLKQDYARRIFVSGPYGLPLTPLIGIQTPSCVIECGVQKPEQIEELARAIAQALLTD